MFNSLFKLLAITTLHCIVFTSSLSHVTPETKDENLPIETNINNEGNLTFEISFFYQLPFIVFNKTRKGCVNDYQLDVHRKADRTSTDKGSDDSHVETLSSVYFEMKTEENKTVGACNGNLLTSQWVLTTAFCLEAVARPFSFIAVHAGILNRGNDSIVNASQTLYSTQFLIYNDVALIRVNSSVLMTATVQPVNLSLSPWNFTTYQNCALSGHELIHLNNGQVRRVKKTTVLNVTKTCFCSNRLEQDLSWENSNPWFCSEPVKFSICPDYLGSAVVCEGKLAGLVTMDVTVQNTETCDLRVNHFCTGHGRERGVTINIFQSTCHHLRWINFHVKMFNDSQIPTNCDFLHQQNTRPMTDLVNGFLALNALICAFMLICGRFIFKLYTKTQ